MALKNIERIRADLVSKLQRALGSFRSNLSMYDTDPELIALMSGKRGDALLADLTESVLLHLGHVNEVTTFGDGVDGRASQARKAARGRM